MANWVFRLKALKLAAGDDDMEKTVAVV